MKLEFVGLCSFLLVLFGGLINAEDNTNLRSRRLSTPALDPKSVILKELATKGYVCEIGGKHWTNDQILQHLDSFVEAWDERRQLLMTLELSPINSGGNGLYHAFIMWAAIKNVKPTLIVESGVHMGATSWLIERASREWGAVLAFVDPFKKGWEPTSAQGRTVHDFRGDDNFKDFTELPWDSIQSDRSNALVFFDDHMDQLRRLKEAHDLGFGHVMFDDNYIAGTGDIFSIKDACDEHGTVRKTFSHSPKRCDAFHQKCADLSDEQGKEAFAELASLAEIVWEGPPMTELVTPYLDVQIYAESGQYEGPNPWIPQIHTQLVKESSKEPLLDNAEEVAQKFQLSIPRLHLETGRYMNVVYIKLKK